MRGFTIVNSTVKTQAPLKLRSPAKINPILRVLRRRDDGYHDVALCLLPVSLYDTVTIGPGPAGIRLTVDSAQALGDPSQNLVHRAAAAFCDAMGEPPALTLGLTKHIPAGAGLGGGSGNAAAVLLGLNALAGYPLAGERLAALALGLGADVPYFLNPQPCWGLGRGERLAPISAPPSLPLLIVVPPLGISTGEAYAQVTPRAAPTAPPTLDTPEALVAALHNDFAAPLGRRHPVLGEVRDALLGAGARAALLTGSGSATVGYFADETTQQQAAATLSRGTPWQVFPCHTLARHDYALPPPAGQP